MTGQQQPPAGDVQHTSWAIVERLLAGAAVTGAAIYVLLNALYIEFYDDFGVRPEEVGLDRLAVLGRAAWLALVALSLAGPIAVLVTYATARRGLQQASQELADLDTSIHHVFRSEDDASKPEKIEIKRLEIERAEKRAWTRRTRAWRHMLVGILAAILLGQILVGFILLRYHVEDRATDVPDGINVGGIGPFIEFIDVRATHAEATWLGKDEKMPTELRSPHLMYLGQGPNVAAFLSCGRTTVVVPADQVAVDLLDRGNDNVSQSKQGLPAACRNWTRPARP